VNTRTHQGYVKTYLVERGFGFCKITSPENALDVFFHISELERAGIKQVAVGDRLAFNIVQDAKSGRYKAADICFADDM
jgi:CspA family cold shock protein